MNDEIWSVIPDYPNYEVSTYGYVRNVTTSRILKNSPNPQGYQYVTLYNDDGAKVFGVHRIVGEVYLDGDITDLEINHKDLDKSNNHYSNLEIETPIGNTMHAYISGAHANNPQYYPVSVFDSESGEQFSSLSEAARALGISPQAVNQGIGRRRVKGRLLERNPS